MAGKSEDRNPKSERSPKTEARRNGAAGRLDFRTRFSGFFRISGFGFRIFLGAMYRNLVVAVLDELMTAKGYEKLADGAYYDARAGLLVFDLFPRNAIQPANGNVYPIDPVVQRVTPEFGQFLREQPFTINLR